MMDNLIIVIAVSGIVSFSVSFWFMIKTMKLMSAKNLKLMDDFFESWNDSKKDFLEEMNKRYFK